ncbi:MAG: M28 family peptidase, partial [Alphaproteobacteria bacterium]|nr:M28 family peptidase [Alphaproteobacteria bacterium]
GVNDWTTQSDHALFHELGMPFLYLGVEDHPDYHKPTDDFSVIPLDFYVRAADTATSIVRAADANLPDIHALRRAPDETAQPEGHAE